MIFSSISKTRQIQGHGVKKAFRCYSIQKKRKKRAVNILK